MTNYPTWQDNLDPKLLQKLSRPLVQPGVIESRIATAIIERSQRFTNRLPLVTQLIQRHQSVAGIPAKQVPIVYAQPQPCEPETGVNRVPAPDGKTAVVQAKFASLREAEPLLFSRTELKNENQSMVVQAKFATPNPLSSVTPSSLSQPENMDEAGSKEQRVVPAKFADIPSLTSLTATNNTNSDLVSPRFEASIDSHSITNPILRNRLFNQSELGRERSPIVYPQYLPISTKQSDVTNEIKPVVDARLLPITISNSSNTVSSLITTSMELKNQETKEILNSESSYQKTNPAIAPDLKVNSILLYLRSDNPKESPDITRVKETTLNSSLVTTDVSPVWLTDRYLAESDRTKTIPSSRTQLSAVQETRKGWLQVNKPLVFSSPGIAAMALGIKQTKDISNTEFFNQKTNSTIGSELQVNPRNSVIHHKQEDGHIQTAKTLANQEQISRPKVDIDALADRVERKLMRRLIVENERRGRNKWS